MLRVVTISQNMCTGRYHPFVWRLAPAPSSDPSDRVHRHKSLGHHTDGFGSYTEAVAFVKDKLSEDVDTAYLSTYDATDYWGEDEKPVRIAWFEVS